MPVTVEFHREKPLASVKMLHIAGALAAMLTSTPHIIANALCVLLILGSLTAPAALFFTLPQFLRLPFAEESHSARVEELRQKFQ